MVRWYNVLDVRVNAICKSESKEEYKDQELIQSSTTPDLRNHMGMWQNTRSHHTQESQEVSHFTAGDHKAARNRQGSNYKDKRET